VNHPEPYGFAELRRELAAKARMRARNDGANSLYTTPDPFIRFSAMSNTMLDEAGYSPMPRIMKRLRAPFQRGSGMPIEDRAKMAEWKQGQDFHPPTEGFWSHQTSLGKSPQEIDALWDKTSSDEKNEWFNKGEFDKKLQSQGSPEPRPTTPYQAPMREAAEARASSGEIGPRPSPADPRFGALAAPEPKAIHSTAAHRPLPPAWVSEKVPPVAVSSDAPPNWYKIMEELDRALKGPYYLRNYPAVGGG
jgi:hypothetical protein